MIRRTFFGIQPGKNDFFVAGSGENQPRQVPVETPTHSSKPYQYPFPFRNLNVKNEWIPLPEGRTMEHENALVSLVLEAGDDFGRLAAKLEAIASVPNDCRLPRWILGKPGQKQKIFSSLPALFKDLPYAEIGSLKGTQDGISTPYTAYLPANAPYLPLPAGILKGAPKKIIPWVPIAVLPQTRCSFLGLPSAGWVSDSIFFNKLLVLDPFPDLRGLEKLRQSGLINHDYLSTPASFPERDARPEVVEPHLTKKSRVLAVIPYFNCAQWLAQCLSSLCGQTRPLDGIVVVDDQSLSCPVDMVRSFQGVTLMRSNFNVGPYRLVQSVLQNTNYDAYLFQDADDWSSSDRLELLLAEAELSGSELIGTQELMYLSDNVMASLYPLDVNRALSIAHGYSLLHPSSLVSKRLIGKTGGYATGLRFSGDIEFLCRARFAGKISNINRYGYFRRIRENSLITSAATGLASPARRDLDRRVWERSQENKRKVAAGQPPLLEPLDSAGPVPLKRLMGPSLSPVK